MPTDEFWSLGVRYQELARYDMYGAVVREGSDAAGGDPFSVNLHTWFLLQVGGWAWAL